MSYDLIAKRMVELPAGDCYLLAKTIGNLERNVLGPMRERFGARYISPIYKRAHGALKVSIFGRENYCVGANDISAVAKIQGGGAVYYYGDEVTTWPQEVFQMIKSRLDKPGACFDGTMNPGPPTHWAKKDMIDRAGEIDLKHWHFVIDDNPFLPPEFVRELKAEYKPGSVWYKRYILGLWAMAEGAIYDMLDETRHVVDTLPAITRYWLGVDYGTASVTCFWLLGLGADNRLYFVDFWRHDAEQARRQLTDVQFAEALEHFLADTSVTAEHVMVPSDAASFATTLQQFKAAGRLPHVRGITFADRSPGSVLRRIRSTSSLLSLGRLLFSRTVERKGGLREWMSRCWDAKAQQIGEDEPLKQNDHDTDAGEYALGGARSIWRSWIQEAA